MRTIRVVTALLVAAAIVLPGLPSASASRVIEFCLDEDGRTRRCDRLERGPQPQAVVALIDTGINPYSPAFRDDSKLAFKHPSKYIPGYPKEAEALRLSLDLPYDDALKEDADVW